MTNLGNTEERKGRSTLKDDVAPRRVKADDVVVNDENGVSALEYALDALLRGDYAVGLPETSKENQTACLCDKSNC